MSMVGERVELRSEVEIAAPAIIVWQVLTNFAAYSEWNPLIVEAQGEAGEGCVVNTTVNLPGYREQKVRRRITKLVQQQELWWAATQLMRAVAFDEQFFVLNILDEFKVRLRIGQNISGMLAPKSPADLSRISQSINLLNQAIKRRAEALNVNLS